MMRPVPLAILVSIACSCSSSGGTAPNPDGGSRDAAPHRADAKFDGRPGPSDSASGDSETGGPDASGDGGIVGLDGKTYYVSAGKGSDKNPGTMTSPWKTIQHAGGIVQPGDAVIVEAGSYDGPIFGWDTAPCAGDPLCTVAGNTAHPILFEADPSATPGSVVISAKNSQNESGFDLEPGCNYVDIVGFTVNNDGTTDTPKGSITKAGIALSGCKGNLLSNNTVDGVSGIGGILVDTAVDVVVRGNTLSHVKGTGSTGHGMYVSGSSVGVQVIANHVFSNDYVGIHVNGDVSEGLPGVAKNILFSGNVIHDNGQNGINADGIESSTFENNVIYHNARNGIELYQIDAYGGSTSNVIVNNTIDQSTGSGSYAISIGACAYDNQSSQPTPAGCKTKAADTSTGNIAFNNVLLGGAGATSVLSSADLALSTNLTKAAKNLFVDQASGNYTLTKGGPGIGTGVAMFHGASAPAVSPGVYDIGAF